MLKILVIAISFLSIPAFAAFDGSPECETAFRQSEFKVLEGKYVGPLSLPGSNNTEIRLIITGIKQSILDGDETAPLRCVPYLEMQYGVLPVGRIFSISPATNGSYAIKSDKTTAGYEVSVWSGSLTVTTDGLHVDIIDHNQTPRAAEVKRLGLQ